eukprot:1120750-Alexandrium_andersonii.AAC.1
MADIRALELQHARRRKRAARGDHAASVRLDVTQRGGLRRLPAPEALQPPAAAGETAVLVQLGAPPSDGLRGLPARDALRDGQPAA